jgi:hypothetical protein
MAPWSGLLTVFRRLFSLDAGEHLCGRRAFEVAGIQFAKTQFAKIEARNSGT